MEGSGLGRRRNLYFTGRGHITGSMCMVRTEVFREDLLVAANAGCCSICRKALVGLRVGRCRHSRARSPMRSITVLADKLRSHK